MAEFASKGLSGTALGLAIPGTVALANQLLGDGNGILGLGGNQNKKNEQIAQLMNENTELKSRIYTDSEIKQTNRDICELKTEVVKQGADINCIRNEMGLREQIVNGKINEVALTAANGIDKVGCGLACLQKTVDGIASTYVPAGKVTPMPAPYPFPPVPPYPYPFFPPFPPVPPVTNSGSSTTTPTTPTDQTTGG